jgi:hypothetical protein
MDVARSEHVTLSGSTMHAPGKFSNTRTLTVTAPTADVPVQVRAG